jgi:hypothetical protein
MQNFHAVRMTLAVKIKWSLTEPAEIL